MKPNPNFRPTSSKMRRAPFLAHALSALALGIGFASIDRVNGMLIDYFIPKEQVVEVLSNLEQERDVREAAKQATKSVEAVKEDPRAAQALVAEKATPTPTEKANQSPVVEKQAPTKLKPQPQGQPQTTEFEKTVTPEPVKFKRDDLVSQIQRQTTTIPDSDAVAERKKNLLLDFERKRDLELEDRFIMNFFYGLTFAKLGSEINNKFLFKRLPGFRPEVRILLVTPFSILSYYAYSNYYEGRSTAELMHRLKGDFLPLLSLRTLIEYPSNAYLRKTVKNRQMTDDDFRRKLARNKSVSVGLWIVVLTFFYQNSPFA